MPLDKPYLDIPGTTILTPNSRAGATGSISSA